MSDTAFQRWLGGFLSENARSPLDYEIWEAAEAKMQEPMTCGHPRASWKLYETGYGDGKLDGFCSDCRDVEKARREALEAACEVLCASCKTKVPIRAVLKRSILDGSTKDIRGNELGVEAWAHVEENGTFAGWCHGNAIRVYFSQKWPETFRRGK